MPRAGRPSTLDVQFGERRPNSNIAGAIQHRINSIPTLLFFKNGQVVDQVVGLKSKKDFKTKLDQLGA